MNHHHTHAPDRLFEARSDALNALLEAAKRYLSERTTAARAALEKAIQQAETTP